MGFANPWLLLGLAALAIPVFVHLVQREERKGRAFPSLMFVRRIRFEFRRRRKLRDRTLFAVRSLALLAMVLAFARPDFTTDTASQSANEHRRDVVWLLDRSYSMSHPKRWSDAVTEIRERIDALASGERGALIAFDNRAQLVVDLTEDRESLTRALAGLQAGQDGTSLGTAFSAADGVLRQSRAEQRQLVLVSDLQRSALESGGALPLETGVELEIVPIDAPIGANATVLAAQITSHGEEEVENTLTAKLGNTGDAPLNDVDVVLLADDHLVATYSLSLAPGEERNLDFPIVLSVERPTKITIRVGPDNLAADDLYHTVFAPRRPVIAALIEPDTPRVHHGVFLEEALRLSHTPAFEVRRVPGREVDKDLLANFDVVIMDDITLPSPSAIRDVEVFVEEGGGLLLVAGPSSGDPGGGGFLGHLLGRVQARDSGVFIEVLSRDHPLWSDLPENGALSGARVSTSWELNPEPNDRVLARLSDGAPLLIEHKSGAGRVLVLATTADTRWGTLVLEPGFVPLVYKALAYLAGGTEWQPAYEAGEVVDLAEHAAGFPGTADWRRFLMEGGAVLVEQPGGDTLRLQEPYNALVATEAPGIYEAHRADGRGPELPFAVNVGRAESMLSRASPGELEHSVVRRVRDDRKARSTSEGNPVAPLDLAWWLLALAGVALVVDSLMTGWLSLGRKARNPS